MKPYVQKISLFLCISLFSWPALAECVILLHGLSRSDFSLRKLEKQLENQGYVVINQDYPSISKPVEELAPQTIEQALQGCDDSDSVSFVTHSMGGILVRYYLKHYEIPNLQSVVMLAPPNAGSQVVDKLGGLTLFRWINGPAGTQLGTRGDSLPIKLGAVNYSVGVIAGDYSFNPLLSTLIPGPDDGKVAIDNTKVAGMADHLVLPVSHIFIMNNDEVIRQTIHFLKYNNFSD